MKLYMERYLSFVLVFSPQVVSSSLASREEVSFIVPTLHVSSLCAANNHVGMEKPLALG